MVRRGTREGGREGGDDIIIAPHGTSKHLLVKKI
jgi:hypothetical protein